MRWLVEQVLVASLGLALASADAFERLSFECKGAAFNIHKSKGRLSGPVRVRIGDWIIECSREVLVTARTTLVRDKPTGTTGVEGGKKRFIFLGQCRASRGLTCFEAPALILDLENLTITGSGLGMTLSDEMGQTTHSTNSDALAILDLDSGQLSQTGQSWSKSYFPKD